MLEFEKKILLSAIEYETIIKTNHKQFPEQIQTNYYFDTDDFLMNKRGITYRVREKNGKFKATIKNRTLQKPDCSKEVDLYKKTKFDPNPFNIMGLKYQGKLVTKRITLLKDDYCEVVLDRNDYLGCTDYELEIEYHEGCEIIAQIILEYTARSLINAGILKDVEDLLIRARNPKSKSQRFFQRKAEGR